MRLKHWLCIVLTMCILLSNVQGIFGWSLSSEDTETSESSTTSTTTTTMEKPELKPITNKMNNTGSKEEDEFEDSVHKIKTTTPRKSKTISSSPGTTTNDSTPFSTVNTTTSPSFTPLSSSSTPRTRLSEISPTSTISTTSTRPHLEQSEIAEIYIDKNLRVINGFLNELQINQYQVALNSVNKVQSYTNDLQSSLAQILSGRCRNSNNNDNINTYATETVENDDDCKTLRKSVDIKIEEYEEIMKNNRAYRSLTNSLYAEYKGHLLELHQNYSTILRKNVILDNNSKIESSTTEMKMLVEFKEEAESTTPRTTSTTTSSTTTTTSSTTATSTTTEEIVSVIPHTDVEAPKFVSSEESEPSKSEINNKIEPTEKSQRNVIDEKLDTSLLPPPIPSAIMSSSSTEKLNIENSTFQENTDNPSSCSSSLASSSLVEKFQTIENCTNWSHKVSTFKYLIQEVIQNNPKNNSEIFQLAALFNQSGDAIELLQKSSLQFKFPQVVQKVVWGKKTQLKIMTMAGDEKTELRLTITSEKHASSNLSYKLATERDVEPKKQYSRIYYWEFFPVVTGFNQEKERGNWFLFHSTFRNLFVGMTINQDDSDNSSSITSNSHTESSRSNPVIILDWGMTTRSMNKDERYHWKISLMCQHDVDLEDATVSKYCSAEKQLISFVNRKYPDFALDIDAEGNIYLGAAANPGMFRVTNKVST